MSLKIGIIGLSNVGKSTLFNALTKAEVPAMNYPFCTIEPNVGVVMTPDQQLIELAKLAVADKITGAAVNFVDIAGLVQGASQGEGLGNQFLAHIREVDAVLHVVRAFPDLNVAKVEGDVDPLADIGIVETELLLADLQVLENRIEKTNRLLKTGERKYKEELKYLEQAMKNLNQGDSLAKLKPYLPVDLPLLSTKPVLYVVNVDEDQLLEQDKLQDITAQLPGESIVLSASLETELANLTEVEAQEFLEELGLVESGLKQVINASIKLFDLITFYTIKGNETRAWMVPRGTLAPQAAGQIHSDMERGFIKAEVIESYRLLESGSFAEAREAGYLRLEGKEYPVQDDDVILFHFNV